MTDRREFVQQATGIIAGIPAALAFRAPGPALAIPSAAQLAWHDLEIGMFVHFAPNTWQDQEYDDHSTPLSRISPEIDTDQWADAAVALGARYIVMVLGQSPQPQRRSVPRSHAIPRFLGRFSSGAEPPTNRN